MRGMRGIISKLSVAGRFNIISLIILVAGMLGIGSWVQRQIGEGIIHGTGHTTSLYVGSFVVPALQGLASGSPLSSEQVAALDAYFQAPALREQIPAFKIWGPDGVVLYATDPGVIGRRYPIEERLARAWRGETSTRISNLEAGGNIAERPLAKNLLETYSPLYVGDATQVAAVVVFYQQVDQLRQEIAAAQTWSWVLVAGAMAIIYLLLRGFVQRASNTIVAQQTLLSADVVRLQELLAQNQELSDHLRRASEGVATITERFLRRLSAELHDGPAQDLSLALLYFDLANGASTAAASTAAASTVAASTVAASTAAASTAAASTAAASTVAPAGGSIPSPEARTHVLVQQALQRALSELRAIATGLGIPELEHLSLSAAIERAVGSHEQRTGMSVRLSMGDLPGATAESIKLTSYRLIQESLTNAYRHAGGRGQAVDVQVEGGDLILSISDEGPGFDTTRAIDDSKHLGISGMRERVQAEGGSYRLESAPDRGTHIVACLPLKTEEEVHGGEDSHPDRG